MSQTHPCPQCKKEIVDNSLYCSEICMADAGGAEPFVPEPQKDYELTEIEVQKINLQPGDTLMVTIKNDEITHEAMNNLRVRFKTVFPKNQVFVFGMGTDGDVKFAVVSQPEPAYNTVEENK